MKKVHINDPGGIRSYQSSLTICGEAKMRSVQIRPSLHNWTSKTQHVLM